MKTEQQIAAAFETDGEMDGLISWLAGISADNADYDPAPDDVLEPCIDVRLQYHDGGFTYHSGDASYDLDHRGYWGASSVEIDETDETLRAIAKDLLDQVLEAAAMSA